MQIPQPANDLEDDDVANEQTRILIGQQVTRRYSESKAIFSLRLSKTNTIHDR